MHTEGRFAPETATEARERFDALGPTAQTVVREVATAMEFPKDEYDERVTGEVVERARNALFATSLEVHVGSREEFDAWREDHPDYEATVAGNENVDRVAWHAAPFADRAVAAMFADEERAAIETLRRQAFGRLYRDEL
ncbi:DUF5809 family protein [Halococcus sp. PRR34]|uniref:DUF5809 family protein n=1 Tax=Halococcus sp. PRR34 TaxID=3020830 RepID=UPI002361DA0D|nr:DUF5809 family protein [Halococcus sp. PRR34]